MIRRRNTSLPLAIALIGLVGALPPIASASPPPSPAPAWDLSLTSQPTNFVAGSAATGPAAKALPQYTLVATNIGGAATNGPITVTDTLPTGLEPAAAAPPVGLAGNGSPISCGVTAQTITCTSAGPFGSGRAFNIQIPVEVEAGLPELTMLTDTTTVSGGGALAATASTTTTISSTSPAFGFLAGHNGLGVAVTDEAGLPVTQAGSHPYQLTVDLGLSTQASAQSLNGADLGVRDIVTALPKGIVADPTATPVRCTEAELESSSVTTDTGCPEASQVGVLTATTFLSGPTAVQSPLYNMAAPTGTPALLGVNALNVGVFIHIEGGVRAGDYAITAKASDIIDRPINPVLGSQVQLWGDPSSALHDGIRGGCRTSLGACHVTPRVTPFLSMPTACTESLSLEAEADSWGHPGAFAKAKALFSDANGNATAVTGCDGLQFDPSLRARPTSEAADSPSGLEALLHIPQTSGLSTPATAHLRNAVVTLPEGLVINPASGNGLAACSSAQIGLGQDGPPSCPDASKIGTVEVSTPLLDHPLPGSVYVASPHDNPFGSLLAIYVVVDDTQSGVVVKLAGHVVADPDTGRLTTSFEETPQLPFEDFKLDFFGGSSAALRTPATCGHYTTTSELTPWSAPASGPPATPSDDWAISSGANGSACAHSPSEEPNSPSFEGGTQNPVAGSYSPFTVRLQRADGSQQISSLQMTFPPGLTGKLAGVSVCPDTALEAAKDKSGAEELAHPSCPAASEIGEVAVGAGAGPRPYYASGKIYLTGPYQGAPLSAAIVTPAVAGPYDLGTVVVRAAGHIDPATAQLSVKSDDAPHILQGIPLDLRDVRVSLSRPEFTLNPTNCAPMSISGSSLSLLGSSAPLFQRFQVGDCGHLDYAPNLFLRLYGKPNRGAHPRLRAVLKTKPGEANTSRTSVALPHSEFIENAHFQTVCTRVQFAAQQCPAGSIYGHARAITPLLDEPLEGPVYLRSSSHQLPDMVAALRGPPSRPIEVELDGRIDSVNGGIRTTFEAVPDQPVSKFILNLKGGNKGLIVNSTNICAHTYRATARFNAQNGKTHDFHPPLKSKCGARSGRRHRQQR